MGWGLLDLLGGGQWSQLCGVIRLQWVIGLFGTPGGIAKRPLRWFTSCGKGSWMPGLFSPCYCLFVTCLSVPLAWDYSGEPFDISWALFSVNTKSIAFTKALPGSVCFCGCWNSLKNGSTSSYGQLYRAHLCVHMVEHVMSFTAQWDMIVPNSDLYGIPINVSLSPPLKALNVN